MTKTGYRLSDIGEVLPWPDVRDFVNHLPQDSALFRDRHPHSWWWTPDMDLLAAIITGIQWGNWQRGGGKGDKPRPIERPIDRPKTVSAPRTAGELAARKKALKQKVEGGDDGD